MGELVFSDEAEKKFLLLWRDMLISGDKKMLGRKEVAKVAEQLNSYLVEIGRPEEQYTESQVNNKIELTTAKGRYFYKNISNKRLDPLLMTGAEERTSIYPPPLLSGTVFAYITNAKVTTRLGDQETALKSLSVSRQNTDHATRH